jgi:hypothetical protein
MALFFEDSGVEEIGAGEIGFQGQGFEENDLCAFGVAFLDADAANIGPAVEIFREPFR